MKEQLSPQLGSIALVLASMLSLTIGASLAKSLFEIAGPSGITVVRIGFGAFLLGALWRPWRFALSREQFKWIFLYGVCLGAMNLSFYFAIARLPIGLAIAIEFLGPLSVALFFSKRLIDLSWALLAAVGVILILPVHELSPDVDLVGVVFALAAAVAWALYIILGKKAGSKTHAGAVTSIGMLIALLVVAPFGAIASINLFSSPTLIFAAFGVGLLSSAIPYSFEMIALRNLPERYFGLLMSLEPAIGATVAFIFIGEVLTPLQAVAVACVIAASVGSSYSSRKVRIAPVVP